MMTKVFAKKLFGAKYEKIMRNLIISVVLFIGLFYSGLHIVIAPFVIFLMTTAVTVGEMWHALSSDDNAANMKQIFMMPMAEKEFIGSYVFCYGGYIFLTRTFPLLGIIFAVAGLELRMVAIAILCVINATLLATGIYVWRRYRIPAIIWLGGIIAAFRFLNASVLIWAVLGASIVLEIVFLMNTDVYAFYREEGGMKKAVMGGKHHSVWRYIFRYIASHGNYMVNGLFIWGVAAVLPFFFRELMKESATMYNFAVPIGFALLSLNTPICILISSDPDLELAIRCLPGQRRAFFVPYFLFIFVCNAIADAIYLASLQLQIGGVNAALIAAAVIFALISALLSVLLECFFPIRGWKVINELWNHPRKYIVPGIMVILAGTLGAGIMTHF